MPRDTKEPQSYGSNRDWLTGKTGQQPNDPDAAPPASQQPFYDERRDGETSRESQGGEVSPEQLSESADANDSKGVRSPATVTDTPSGARRNSFFKDRDYK